MTKTLVRSPLTDSLNTWDHLFRSFWDSPVADVRFSPAADVYRDDEDLVARFDLPGLNPDEDVVVEAEGRRLTVRGERKDASAEEQDGRFREVRFGSFRRVVTLPQAVDASAVSASYDSGVLTVRVAGVYAGTTPSRIEITNAA